jgi:hypothetical protein
MLQWPKSQDKYRNLVSLADVFTTNCRQCKKDLFCHFLLLGVDGGIRTVDLNSTIILMSMVLILPSTPGERKWQKEVFLL